MAQLDPNNRVMSTKNVITRLVAHGCHNVTDRLDLSTFGVYPISSGGFGDVYRGKLLGGSRVAIKTMKLYVDSDKAQKPLKDAARELHTWSKCQHKNVLKLIGLVEFRGQIGMVSPFMRNGNLVAYLEQHPTTDRCKMSTGVCDGLVYLHQSGIIHGDLKGLNVLISSAGTPALTDFGNAVLKEGTLKFASSVTRTGISPRWAAPELLEGSGMYSFAADVYSLGMTILETTTGNVPFAGRTEQAVYFTVAMKKEFPARPESIIAPHTSEGDELWSILTRCWANDPSDRPDANEVYHTMRGITDEGIKVDID